MKIIEKYSSITYSLTQITGTGTVFAKSCGILLLYKHNNYVSQLPTNPVGSFRLANYRVIHLIQGNRAYSNLIVIMKKHSLRR